MQSKSQLINTNETWNAKKRYKINAVVTYLGSTYQNSTGGNSDPISGNDWFLIEADISGKEDKINKGVPNGYASLGPDGFTLLSEMNPSTLERLVVVADQAARFALTTATVQNGDTVKQLDTGIMYYVKDDTNLSNSSGYELYRAGTAASVPWAGVTGTPTSISGYGIIPASGDYTTALVTETTDKNYQTDIQKLYNDATSSIQTQLNNRALVSQLNTNSITNNSLVTGGTTTDALNTLNTGLVYKKTIAQIRALSGTLPSNNFYTTDINKEGNWSYDSTDTTTADNTGTILVTADGKRIKRIYQNLINVKWFGVKGNGADSSDGSITSGSNVFTSPTGQFTPNAVGKIVGIKGAGVSASYLITTVTSFINSTTIVLSANASTTVSNAIFFIGSDDTVLIQNAINSVYELGGGKLFFPKGVYILNGALQTSTGTYSVNPNSQLWIPYEYKNLDRTTKTTIEFEGEFQPNLHQPVGISTALGHNTGSVLRSTIQGSGTLPSVIGSKGGSPLDFEEFNRNNFAISNMQIQLLPNAANKITLCGLNMRKSSLFNAESVTIFPYMLGGADFGNPDVIDITGIYFPMINCERINTANKCSVGGFTNGFYLGEHSSVSNSEAVCCFNALSIGGNYHVNYISNFASHWCKYDISPKAMCYFRLIQLKVEYIYSGKWFDNTATINDPSNFAIGVIDNYSIVEAALGNNTNRFKKIGGVSIKTTPMLINYSNIQPGTSYTFTIEDGYRVNNFTAATAVSATIAPDSTCNFDLNTVIKVQQSAAGKVSFVAGSGVTLNTPITLGTRVQRSMITATKVAANVWVIGGDLG